MTREEYTIKQERSKLLSESMLNAISYISSLEKRITELEVQLADANSYFDDIHTELLVNKIKES